MPVPGQGWYGSARHGTALADCGSRPVQQGWRGVGRGRVYVRTIVYVTGYRYSLVLLTFNILPASERASFSFYSFEDKLLSLPMTLSPPSSNLGRHSCSVLPHCLSCRLKFPDAIPEGAGPHGRNLCPCLPAFLPSFLLSYTSLSLSPLEEAKSAEEEEKKNLFPFSPPAKADNCLRREESEPASLRREEERETCLPPRYTHVQKKSL